MISVAGLVLSVGLEGFIVPTPNYATESPKKTALVLPTSYPFSYN